MGTKLRALGFRTRFQAVRRQGVGFYNLLARRGPAGGRPLLLNTHTDTVPPGPSRLWTSTGGNPWKATRRAGRLHGLGAADVKLNLLCQYWALRRSQGERFRRPLCLAATFGEESGLLGAQRLVRAWKGPRPAFALVGEPSELRLIDRHRGYLVFEWKVPDGPGAAVRQTGTAPPIRQTGTTASADGSGGRTAGRFREVRFAGRAAHSSTPHLGVNAAERALQALRRWERQGLGTRVVSFTAGTAANQVPAEAVLRVAATRGEGGVDWRAVAEGIARAKRGLPSAHSFNVGVVRRLARATEVVFDVRFPPAAGAAVIRSVRRALGRGVRVERNNPGLSAPRPGRGWKTVRSALADAGLSGKALPKATCTEAGVYSRWGVPAAVWGPGRSVGNIHRPNESVPLRDLDRAVDFYAKLVEAWAL